MNLRMRAPLIAILSLCLNTLVGQVPVLNSNRDATATIFLDFDGQLVRATVWNWDQHQIDAQPCDLSTNKIIEIFNRVAEDFRIFNLNITTDSSVYAATDPLKRLRMIVTPTWSWYGEAGGVAYIGSFNWGDDTPGWVFSGLLQNNPKFIAEAISHEVGHAMGLHHQSYYDSNCVKLDEYAPGTGAGELSWAPIMGLGYFHNITTWYTGKSAEDCSIIQNDIEIIAGPANNFGLRADDHGGSLPEATPLQFDATGFSIVGMINTEKDQDVFKFTLNKNRNIRLAATPANADVNNGGANLDLQITLLNTQLDTIGCFRKAELLSAAIDTNLTAGTYYILVGGCSNENIPSYGNVGLYSLTGFQANALPVTKINLTGRIADDKHALNWNFYADEPLNRIEVQTSVDGVHFTTLTTLTTEQRNFSWKPIGSNLWYYRLRIVTELNEMEYYSKIISLQAASGNAMEVLNKSVLNSIQVFVSDKAHYQLFDEAGRLIQQGRLSAGVSNIVVNSSAKGLLLLRLQTSNLAKTYKLIKQ
jgi:hypothetical protein